MRICGIVRIVVTNLNTTMTSSSEGDGSYDDANATNADGLNIANRL